MKDKTQDVNSLEDLLKAANDFRKWAIDFGNELSKALADIKAPKEDTWEMKCPYEYGDKHYCIQSSGDIFSDFWEGIEADNRYFSQGNIFPTEKAAELEAKRRNLLTRFRAFRDECNNGWKPDWNINNEKYFLYFSADYEKFYAGANRYCYMFNLFGYFKNKKDAQRAIDLFGDEIKEFFVDCEVQ